MPLRNRNLDDRAVLRILAVRVDRMLEMLANIERGDRLPDVLVDSERSLISMAADEWLRRHPDESTRERAS